MLCPVPRLRCTASASVQEENVSIGDPSQGSLRVAGPHVVAPKSPPVFTPVFNFQILTNLNKAFQGIKVERDI